MSKWKEYLQSPHIQIAIATGIILIVMSYFSKHILAEPIRVIHQAIPPFIGTMYFYFYHKHKDKWISKTWYWIIAMLMATTLIIMCYMI